jgi:hypothetical protein
VLRNSNFVNPPKPEEIFREVEEEQTLLENQ